MFYLSLKNKVLVLAMLFSSIFIGIGITILVLVNDYDKQVRELVSLNNSFLVLGSSLNYYRDFSSLSLTPYLVQNDFDIDQIKIYQQKHKVLILDVLSKLRENLYNIDVFYSVSQDKLVIQKIRDNIYKFQSFLINQLEKKEQQFNYIIMFRFRNIV